MAALLAVVVGGAAPVPPTTNPVAAVRQWVKELADQDPEVRDRARVGLMGIERGLLSELRNAVAEARPLAPSQIAELPKIVNHVYLSGEREESRGEAGFLGVKVAQVGVEVAPGPGVRAEGMPVGIAVAERVPGYCGYRMLQDGDVILRLTSEKAASEFRNSQEFTNVVAAQRAGETVKLDVVRRGKVLQLPIRLDRKPTWAEPGAMQTDDAIGTRQRRAGDYWDREFGPLVEERRS